MITDELEYGKEDERRSQQSTHERCRKPKQSIRDGLKGRKEVAESSREGCVNRKSLVEEERIACGDEGQLQRGYRFSV